MCEPTTYLDIRYQLQILRLIRRLNEEYGFTIIMVLHDVNQSLYYSDEIVALKAGKCIAQGSPQQILSGELIQKVYDVTLKVSDIQSVIVNNIINDIINNKIKTVTAKTFCNGFCDNSVLLSCRKSQNISKSKL